MNLSIIKTGFCVAYDWHLLKNSLPRVYEDSDIICLALDENRKSWSGNPYKFDNEAFHKFVEKIDKDKKIIVYEDDFALPHLNARENGNRHRTKIAEVLGKGGWHIQVDSDEYLLNFKGFTNYLKKLNPCPKGNEKPVNVRAIWYSLVKKLEDGYIYIDYRDAIPPSTPFASNSPKYEVARVNGHFNIQTPFIVIHETWARGEDELLFKLNNWGHSVEELENIKYRNGFMKIWRSLDKYNYQYIKDFHFINPKDAPCLAFCAGRTIEEFIQNFDPPALPYSKFQLSLLNNRNIARLKSFFSKRQ